MIFRLLWPPTHAFGLAQAWLAAGFREGTSLEKLLIFPSWLVCRGVFLAMFSLCEAAA